MPCYTSVPIKQCHCHRFNQHDIKIKHNKRHKRVYMKQPNMDCCKYLDETCNNDEAYQRTNQNNHNIYLSTQNKFLFQTSRQIIIKHILYFFSSKNLFLKGRRCFKGCWWRKKKLRPISIFRNDPHILLPLICNN